MGNTRITLLGTLVAVCAGTSAVQAEDWPTYMHDNQRTGVTTESLEPPLELAWFFRSPFPPAKGWAMPVNGYGARKNKPNVSYDDAFRAIAVDDTCYFCSSSGNRVYAINADSGTVKWTFFTDAAPRLAPAYWRGKLYIGADDGIFRCLDARDGTLLWQVQAAPRDDLVLGQGRFSSVWPIRAGGIVEDGIVYFTAGLFPYQHLYFFAVDAVEGKIRWCRQIDDGGRLGHVPQGHILAADDSLFTTSRAAPARWSKSDGSRIEFNTPFPDVPDAHEYRFYNGGSYAQIWQGRNIVYGRACVLAYDPDGELKDKWGRTRKGELIFNWFNARQALFDGSIAYLATDYHVLAVKQDLLQDIAKNQCRQFEETYKRLRVPSYLDLLDRRDRLVQERGEDDPHVRSLEQGPLQWGRENWLKWPDASAAIFDKFRQQCEWMTPLKATEAFVLAGDVIYAGGEDEVAALHARTGRRLWNAKIGSRVRGFAVANGRLYVSSIDGAVRCFVPAADRTETVQNVTVEVFHTGARADRVWHGLLVGRDSAGVEASTACEQVPHSVEQAYEDRQRRLAQMAKRLVGEADSQRGYCLIVGGDNAALAAEIARTSDYSVELIPANGTDVQAMRQELAAAGLYGGRACVRRATLARLPYPPYVFNLLIDQGSFVTGEPSVPVAEMFRVSKPCGGVCLLLKQDIEPDESSFAADLQKLRAQNGNMERIGRLLKITRGRIPLSRDWTHNYANAANTYCSEDPHVKGPFGVSWYGEPGPRKRIERHATPPVPLVVGSTLFTIGYDLVMAYDVYNGVQYWEREIQGATRQNLPIHTSNMAADDRSLFLVLDNGECWRLDARTGETLSVYSVPKADGAESAKWAWIALDGNLLYGSRAEYDDRSRRTSKQTSGTVFALDKDTGATAWTYQGQGIDHDGIAIGDGRVFLVDRGLTDAERRQAQVNAVKDPSVADRTMADQRGKPIVPDLRKLVALDAASGRMLWQAPLDATDITLDDTVVQGRGGVACMHKDGVVLVHGTGSLGHPHKEFLRGEFARRALYAFDSATGELLWGGRKGYRKRPVVVADHIYAEPFAWHLRTGKPKTIPNPLSGKYQLLDFHRGYIGCSHILASASTLFGAKGGVGYLNLDDRCGFTPFGGVALACGLCAVPAAGVFAAPEGRSGCTCDVPIHTSMTLYPKPTAEAWSVGFAGGRADVVSLPVKTVSVNLGAPGFREDGDGNLWIPYPARIESGIIGDWLPAYQHDQQMCYRLNELSATIAGAQTPWVFTTGYSHDKPLKFRLVGDGQTPGTYTVRLLFAEPEDLEMGQRVFSVKLMGETVLENLDVLEAAGGPRRALVKEFREIEVKDELEIRLLPSRKSAMNKPILCGFQAFRE